jgi:hypothetical protein
VISLPAEEDDAPKPSLQPDPPSSTVREISVSMVATESREDDEMDHIQALFADDEPAVSSESGSEQKMA